MQNRIHMTRLGGTAIAAVLALTATPALAQEATPQEVPQISVPDEPAATTSTTTTTTTTSEPAATPTADPLAAAPAPETTKTTTTTKVTKTTTRKPVANRAAAATPRAAAPVATSAAPAPAPTLPTDPAAAAPLAAIPAAPIAATPEPAPSPAPVEATAGDDVLPIALGAGLGLLALGGAAFALRRRRRIDGDDYVMAEEPTFVRDEPAVQPEPAITIPTNTPLTAERSAFNWSSQPAATASSASTGGNWIDRAYEGPTPENPFLSLKKRLRRAAFYEQRERAVSAGEAAPLSPMAGLPQRIAKAIKPKASTPSFGYNFSYASA